MTASYYLTYSMKYSQLQELQLCTKSTIQGFKTVDITKMGSEFRNFESGSDGAAITSFTPKLLTEAGGFRPTRISLSFFVYLLNFLSTIILPGLNFISLKFSQHNFRQLYNNIRLLCFYSIFQKSVILITYFLGVYYTNETKKVPKQTFPVCVYSQW